MSTEDLFWRPCLVRSNCPNFLICLCQEARIIWWDCFFNTSLHRWHHGLKQNHTLTVCLNDYLSRNQDFWKVLQCIAPGRFNDKLRYCNFITRPNCYSGSFYCGKITVRKVVQNTMSRGHVREIQTVKLVAASVLLQLTVFSIAWCLSFTEIVMTVFTFQCRLGCDMMLFTRTCTRPILSRSKFDT